jgi:hypothetical protein
MRLLSTCVRPPGCLVWHQNDHNWEGNFTLAWFRFAGCQWTGAYGTEVSQCTGDPRSNVDDATAFECHSGQAGGKMLGEEVETLLF